MRMRWGAPNESLHRVTRLPRVEESDCFGAVLRAPGDAEIDALHRHGEVARAAHVFRRTAVEERAHGVAVRFVAGAARDADEIRSGLGGQPLDQRVEVPLHE